jgi:geranylgeranyl diphosphate synthase type II
MSSGAGASEKSVAVLNYRRVPPQRLLRERLREEARRIAGQLLPGQWLSRRKLEDLASQALRELNLGEDYLGWTMVAIASAFWRPQIMAIPFSRRLVLLPHCMRHPTECRGFYTSDGLVCQECGSCPLGNLVQLAQNLGCKVVVAEGSPAVARWIIDGEADAILGVACLESLEKVFDRLVVAGLPAMAVPLVRDGCRETEADIDWIAEMICTPYTGEVVAGRTFLHMLRAIRGLFRPERLRDILASSFGDSKDALSELQIVDGKTLSELDPETATATIAWDFVLRGGKYFRPLLCVAAYDAITGQRALSPVGRNIVNTWPEALWRVAVAVEVFHKASLVHDDIEDNDSDRYGMPTVHARFGVPLALNVGDYLIGQGYRLLEAVGRELGAEILADLLAIFTAAHVKLCRGQGAELVWRERVQEFCDPGAALRIYALKTAPALEAAITAGLRIAGPLPLPRERLGRICRHLGVAYQIQNDLDDWGAATAISRASGGDGQKLRPTLLWALAAQVAGPEETARRFRQWQTTSDPAEVQQGVRQWFEETGVFPQARRLVEKHREQVRQLALQIKIRELADFFLQIEELILG